MLDDITCRLNVNSITRVYSVSLPAHILYTICEKKSTHFIDFFIFLDIIVLKGGIHMKKNFIIGFICGAFACGTAGYKKHAV